MIAVTRCDTARQLAWIAIEYRKEHGGSLDNAFDELSKKAGYPAKDSISKAWKEMRTVVVMDQKSQEMWLFFRGLAAEGKVTMTKLGK